MANVWTSGGSLSTARSDPAGFGTQTASVCVGGWDGTNRINTTEEYNGSAWSAGGNAVVTHRYLAGCGTLTAGLMNGGHNGTDGQNASSEYDGTAWTAGNAMSNARRSHSCFGTQTAAAVNGGLQDLVAWRQDTEEYDGTNYAASNPSSVVHVHVGYCGTQTAGLIVGGQNAANTRIVTVEEYNGTTWSAGGNVSVAVRLLMAFGTQTSAVRAGGEEAAGNITKAESYNGTAWATENSLSAARALLRASGDSTNGFVFSGDNAGVLATTEEWNPPVILLTGAFAAQSGTAGDLALIRGLSGTFAAQSGTSGVLTVVTPGIVNLAGAFAAQSGSAGDLNVIRSLIGSFAAISGATGALTVTGAKILFGVSNFPQGVAVEYQIVDTSGTVVTAWTNTGVVEVQGPSKSGYIVSTSAIAQDFQGAIYWRTPDLSKEAMEPINLNITATNMRGTDNALLAANYTAPDNAGITAIKAKTDTINWPDIIDLHDEALGKWVLDPAGNTLTLYKADGVTVLKTFNLGSTTATVPNYISRTPA